MRRFKRTRSLILDFLFPPVCAGCKEVLPIKRVDGFCEECRDKWNSSKNELCRRCGQPISECWCNIPCENDGLVDAERHLVQYQTGVQSTVKSVIYNLKDTYFERAFDVIAREMYNDFYLNGDYKDAVICAVPRNKSSIRYYGHDQSNEIAVRLSEISGIEYVKVLYHKGNIKQKSLGRNAREQNAQKSYGIVNGAATFLKGKTVILVDDVITTGATVVRCAKLLKMRGASKVVVFAVAKTV